VHVDEILSLAVLKEIELVYDSLFILSLAFGCQAFLARPAKINKIY
jgi:hypothetical protein